MDETIWPLMSAPVAPEIVDVRRRIKAEGLDLKHASKLIGVTLDALARHLAGGYVRSDSLAKYRRWLGRGAAAPARQLKLIDTGSDEPGEPEPIPAVQLVERLSTPSRAHLVVDLFSGCGGMSLGFDALEGGRVFDTVLAIDIEEPMVRAFNANHPAAPGAGVPVCRRVDLSQLLNEAEVLGFYLDHVATLRGDEALRRALDELPALGMGTFVAAVGQVDSRFRGELQEIRESGEYRDAVRRLPAGVLGQTSVIGFHAALGLPMPTASAVELLPMVWGDRTAVCGQDALDAVRGHPVLEPLEAECRSQALRAWNDEAKQLRSRAEGTGRGQLGSSASRIRGFLPFLEEPVIRRVRAAWVRWQTDRNALRVLMFGERNDQALGQLYAVSDYRVSVLLGGPPCQGFSRIGRGKIRSLRDQQVHVQVDAEAGDVRNRLLHKYVLFVAALGPAVFLFENVRHFQAEVHAPEGTYLASEVLAAAIREMSRGGLQYRVANRIIDASRHLVPETRERFFMAGVRADVGRSASLVPDVADWCLSLPVYAPVSVQCALEGLPAPIPVSAARADGAGLEQVVEVADVRRTGSSPQAQLMQWVRGGSGAYVDAHHVRPPREDDAALFGLFGPGKRWMDYRCDDSSTLRRLHSLVSSLREAVKLARSDGQQTKVHKLLAGIDPAALDEVVGAVDGSLSLRLLLETIPPMPGELQHHLMTPAYLAKREGNHGDWMARLHMGRPSKTIVSHMAKDTYAYIHPSEARTLSVREAARIQTFPDLYSFGMLGLVEAFRVIGNAVPPLLSRQLAERVAQVLQLWISRADAEARPMASAGSR